VFDDQFETVSARVEKVKHLCTPADKNGEGVTDPNTHLRGRRVDVGPPFPGSFRNITVRNQFGDIRVDLVIRSDVLVPSSKGVPGGPFLPPPDPLFHDVDHFRCYKIKVTRGTPKFPPGVQATVADQFTFPPKLFDVKKPRVLCAPADKNGEGVQDPARHLMCYKVRPAVGQPPHVPRTLLPVNSQFGPERVTTRKEDWLCVPSEKFLTPPPSTTTSTSTSSTTVTVPTTTSTTRPADHFLMYDALGSPGPAVILIDQWGPQTAALSNATRFLVPVDKNGEGILDPVTHETCYDYSTGVPTGVGTVSIDNQFGPQLLEVVGAPEKLCVPTEKFPGPVPQPLPRDHFNCYPVFGSPVGAPVSLVDQFQGLLSTALNPILFCNPVDKNGGGILNPADHLTCYDLLPEGLAVGPVPIRNQFFDPTLLTVDVASALCVPSTKVAFGP
jgi:hypothetical protein